MNSTRLLRDCGGAAKLNQVRENSTLTLDASPGMADDGTRLASAETAAEWKVLEEACDWRLTLRLSAASKSVPSRLERAVGPCCDDSVC